MARAQSTEVYEPSEVASLLREYADRLEKTPKAPAVAQGYLRSALEAVAEAMSASADEAEVEQEGEPALILGRVRVQHAIDLLSGLSPDERRAVLARLASADVETEELSPEWRKEIECRVEAVRNGTSHGYTREQVRDRVRARLATVRAHGPNR